MHQEPTSDASRRKAIRHWKKWVKSERDENRKAVILHMIKEIQKGSGEDRGKYFEIRTEYGLFTVNAGGSEFSIQWK